MRGSKKCNDRTGHSDITPQIKRLRRQLNKTTASYSVRLNDWLYAEVIMEIKCTCCGGELYCDTCSSIANVEIVGGDPFAQYIQNNYWHNPEDASGDIRKKLKELSV